MAGTLATLLVSLRLGPDTLVEVYDLPLLIAALALFRAGESRLRSAALAMPVLEWLIVHVPPGDRDWISTAELLWGLHLGGAGVLSFLIAHYGLVRLRRIEGPGGNLPSGPCA